jgi:hypothetical protein
MNIENALKAAGLMGLPFSWDATGAVEFGAGLTITQKSAITVAVAAGLADEPKTRAWNAIKAERDRRTEAGGYKVGDHWFHSDQKSRSQQLGLVLLGANIPAGLQWKTMSGDFVAMTQQLAGQILGAAAASDQAAFTVAETHKVAMMASADPAAYDFTGGWPQTFEESLVQA